MKKAKGKKRGKSGETCFWRPRDLGLDQVFLIHGLGAGKLRGLLHARLRNNTGVAWFKNEFHKKYGYGATEVTFK